MIHFDILIIGSGPVALSCLYALPSNLKIAVVTDGLTEKYTLDSLGDKAFINSFGGGLDHWHGVISPELFLELEPNGLDFFKSYFERIYPIKRDHLNQINKKSIFIPNSKICTEHFKEEFNKKKNITLFVDKITSVKEKDNLVFAFSNTQTYSAKKIIIAAGAVGTAKLIKQSLLGEVNSYIGNHLNAYSQYNIQINSDERVTKKTKLGHFKKVHTGNVKNQKYMTYVRPALLDFKNPKKLIKFKTIYSRSVQQIYSTILKSSSPGLLVEALYNRFGFWMAPNNANRYFQIESNNIYYMNENFDIFVDKKNMNEQVKLLKKMEPFSDLESDSVVSGIHYYNTIKECDSSVGSLFETKNLDRKFLIADASILKSIGGSHHTFSIMALAANSLRKIYDN